MMIKLQGQNNWNYRPGYSYVQRVPAPILPMIVRQPGFIARVFGR